MSSDACMPWASFLADSTNHSPGVWTHLPVLSASFHSETVQRLPMSLSKVCVRGARGSVLRRGGGVVCGPLRLLGRQRGSPAQQWFRVVIGRAQPRHVCVVRCYASVLHAAHPRRALAYFRHC